MYTFRNKQPFCFEKSIFQSLNLHICQWLLEKRSTGQEEPGRNEGKLKANPENTATSFSP